MFVHKCGVLSYVLLCLKQALSENIFPCYFYFDHFLIKDVETTYSLMCCISSTCPIYGNDGVMYNVYEIIVLHKWKNVMNHAKGLIGLYCHTDSL